MGVCEKVWGEVWESVWGEYGTKLGRAALLSSAATFSLAVAPMFFRPPATSGSAAVILAE